MQDEGIQITGRDDGVVDGKRRLLFAVVVNAGLLEIPERFAAGEGSGLCPELREALYLGMRGFISKGYQNLERIVSLREQRCEPAFTYKEKRPWPVK